MDGALLAGVVERCLKNAFSGHPSSNTGWILDDTFHRKSAIDNQDENCFDCRKSNLDLHSKATVSVHFGKVFIASN